MKQKIINGIRTYYQLPKQVTDEYIRDNFKGSLGEACVNINIAKESALEAFRKLGLEAEQAAKNYINRIKKLRQNKRSKE